MPGKIYIKFLLKLLIYVETNLYIVFILICIIFIFRFIITKIPKSNGEIVTIFIFSCPENVSVKIKMTMSSSKVSNMYTFINLIYIYIFIYIVMNMFMNLKNDCINVLILFYKGLSYSSCKFSRNNF